MTTAPEASPCFCAQGVSVNALGTESGRSVLSWAAERGSMEVLAGLVTHPEVDINLQDEVGFLSCRLAAFPF